MTQFNAIAFSGGGLRCYWQGGFWEAFNAIHPQNPEYIVALSGGAFQSCFTLAGVGHKVREAVIDGCNARTRDIEFERLLIGKSPFVVGELYPQLMEFAFGEAELAKLKAAPPIRIQICQSPRFMPSFIAAYGAIAAYQIEKQLTDGLYSKAGRYIGMKAVHISTHDIETVEELRLAILASGTVPPFMPRIMFQGKPALDGGLVDNPPVNLLRETESKGGRTLVLATRAGQSVYTDQRITLYPSTPILVNKFSITDGEGVRKAYELGLRDGEAFSMNKEFTSGK
jgi:predicted acylesterase/phospholipase RssA